MSEQVLYSQASPGWCSSGIRASARHPLVRRRDQLRLRRSLLQLAEQRLDGGQREVGREAVAGAEGEQVAHRDRPGGRDHVVDRAGRACGRTTGEASSGSHRSTGSSSAIRPSSTSIMAAAATMGLVIEAMRKIESRAIGAVPSASTEPTASTSTWSPRATRATAPGTDPLPTCRSRTSRRSVVTVHPLDLDGLGMETVPAGAIIGGARQCRWGAGHSRWGYRRCRARDRVLRDR